MNITFIGIGNVGSALADHLAQAGHQVAIGARDPQSSSVVAAIKKNHSLRCLSPLEACELAEVVFLATPFQANPAALAGLETALAGKVLVDCTNPVGAGLTHPLPSGSGSEQVQKLVPAAKVVKAFTIYGYENFEDPRYPGYGDLKPAMLIAGDDIKAKALVARLVEQLGWRPVDAGPLSSALHLEHFCLLWIKMARVHGKGAGFVWAMLERS
ncbi:MAG: NADPH-dependent F420 reductase [Verrucomicrobia bacterium]|nr:NADPH-dependent F420 reductase [Verrucomicrobiota bacterium]